MSPVHVAYENICDSNNDNWKSKPCYPWDIIGNVENAKQEHEIRNKNKMHPYMPYMYYVHSLMGWQANASYISATS